MSEHKNPQSVIETGYNVSKAAASFMEYSEMALECMKVAQNDINACIGSEVVQNVDLARFRASIHRAQAAVQDMEHEHLRASKTLIKKGFPKVTSDDFTALGGTRR